MTQAAVREKNVVTTLTTGERLRRTTFNEFTWIWGGTALIFIVSAILAPGTVRVASISSMLPFAAILAIAAVGQTIVIQQRGLDMSLPGIMTISGLLLAKFGFMTGSLLLAVPLTLVCACLFGILNGLLVAKVNITPIVTTLAVNAILLGAVRTISGGSPMSAPPELAAFSHYQILGVPMTLILALLFIVFISVATRRTVYGRRFVAVGANPAAAAAGGMPVLPYQVGTYAIAAICFAVAGMLYTGFIGSASQTAGNDYLLPAIAAVVVGGTPFTGGRGSVVASGVAALFMVQLGQMVLALGADTSVQLLVQALSIIIAVTIRYIPSALSVLRA
ncbi:MULTISPECIES: ABC transporter permease [Rhizobium/Agrobacterium group]|uniref:ABC transporter permease n=1 Tax=Rhizobium/Agrobacterium group TaxID=227290 RepID=UPI001AD96E96|nr:MULTISPECIES: ABC transporter permease [Rhizobium/Agrobacterium group]MBO9112652.1 ABC transporter permease [Agrobacterium sp. S2/73]QXZ76146.1 ABC transporter permease [Agrobacterium sp. S7/73]QYA17306.1 ABC transporter permease [Rhizobium sp. AB2/73]UEQ85577.1 ABC transporter permease [Rhizobium sp. AB2/73]